MRFVLACAMSAMAFLPAAFGADGLVAVESAHAPKETLDQLEDLVKGKGMAVFARVDHAAGAAKIGKSLRPTELLIFGNPQGGTPDSPPPRRDEPVPASGPRALAPVRTRPAADGLLERFGEGGLGLAADALGDRPGAERRLSQKLPCKLHTPHREVLHGRVADGARFPAGARAVKNREALDRLSARRAAPVAGGTPAR